MKKHKKTPFSWASSKRPVDNRNSGYQPTETTPAAPPTHGSNIRKEETKNETGANEVRILLTVERR